MALERILGNTATAEWILNFAFHSLVVLFVGIFLVRLLKRKAAPLRSTVSLMTIFVLLLLPFLSGLYHSLDLSLYKTSLPFAGSSRLHFFEPGEDGITGLEPEKDIHGFQTFPTMARLEKGRSQSSLFKRILFKITTSHVINGLGLAWLVGFMVLFCRLLYGAASLVRLKKGLTKISDDRLDHILKTLKQTFFLKKLPEVYSSTSVKSPAVFGIIKPLIVLPHDLYGKLGDNELRGILYHELSHIHHKDQVTGILQRIVIALYWWNPVVRALSADFSKAREEISDNYAIMGNGSRGYAECLINLAEKTSLVSRLPFSQGLAIPYIPLKDRISQILSKEREMVTEMKKSTKCLIMLVSLCVIGLIASHEWTFASEKSKAKMPIESEATLVGQQKQENKQEENKAIRPDKPPKLIKKVDPVYPEEARKAGIEGEVVVEATTDKEGNVVKIKVLKGEQDILNKAAIDSIKQWKYEPFILEGKPIGVEFVVTVQFKLKDKDKDK